MRPRALALAVAAIIAAAPAALPESFSFTAAKMAGSTAKGKERTTLTGGARVVSGSLVIEADTIELSGPDYRYMACAGNVTAKDSEKGLLIKTAELAYDRRLKFSRAKGETVMEDRKNGIVIKGAYFENNDDKETTLVQVGVRILKEDMVCRSEYAFYRRKDKVLELSGLPVVYWKGDEYRAARIIVNTDTDEIKLEGKVSGSIDSSKASSGGSTPPATEGAASGGSTPDGTTPSGTVPSGTTPSGTVPDGTVPSGTAPSGTTPDVIAPTGGAAPGGGSRAGRGGSGDAP